MGCTGTGTTEVTPQLANDFAMSIDIAQKKCKNIIKKYIESMKKKDGEIYQSLKQRNLDLSKKRMGSLIKEENNTAALIILNKIFDNVKLKSALMVSSKECPVGLRPPLDSIIYASTRLKIEELNELREKLKQMYGEAYIKKAKNNEDEIVNQDLITRLKGENINEENIKERLIKFIKEKQAIRKSAVNLTLSQSNTSQNPPEQNQPPKNTNNTNNNTNKVNNVNNAQPTKKKEEDDLFGKTVVDTVVKSKKEENQKQDKPSNTNNNNTNNNTNANQLPPGSISIDMLAGLNIKGLDDILGGPTTKTVNMENEENEPLLDEDKILDILGGETCQTMQLSVANPDNKENPYEGNINDIVGGVDPFDEKNKDKIKDAFAGETIKSEGEENKQEEIKPFDPDNMADPLGGPTLLVEEMPINSKEGKDPFDKNNQIEDPFGGKTIPEEEINPKEGKDPFDKNNKIDDPFGGKTISEEGENNEQKEGPDPFDKNAKINDPFGGPTL